MKNNATERLENISAQLQGAAAMLESLAVFLDVDEDKAKTLERPSDECLARAIYGLALQLEALAADTAAAAV